MRSPRLGQNTPPIILLRVSYARITLSSKWFRKILHSISDWTQCTDVSTGHPYYWNIVTKEVTWEMPNEYKKFLDRAKILHPNDLIKWILCYTDDNTPYYFNDLTREISWVKPDGFVEPEQQKSAIEKDVSRMNVI